MQAINSSLAQIAFNTPAIFFLEFLIVSMMYTQLAGDITGQESLLLSHTKLLYLSEHLEVSQARSLSSICSKDPQTKGINRIVYYI